MPLSLPINTAHNLPAKPIPITAPTLPTALSCGSGSIRKSICKSTAELLVADATLSGTWVEGVASYAAGYQFRLLNAAAIPTIEGDVTINPCPVVGDDGCSAEDRFGPYVFTNVNRPYDESQTVHRFFAEVPLSLGARFDCQLAANYEFHDVASSFDPKFGWRYQPSGIADAIHVSARLGADDVSHAIAGRCK